MMIRIKGDEKESGIEFRDLISEFLGGGGQNCWDVKVEMKRNEK